MPINTDDWAEVAEIQANLHRDWYQIADYKLDEDLELEKITRVVGVDFGPPLEIMLRRKAYALAKRPGHQMFAGIGRRRLAPTAYMIIELGLIDQDLDDDIFVFRIIDREEPGHNWRSLVTRFTVRIEKLALEI